MAHVTQGIQLFWSTSTAASTVAGALVGSVTEISGPSGTKPEIDITSLQSTAKEYIMGMPDYGEINVTLNYDSTDVAQNALFADWQSATSVKRKAVIKLNTPTSHILMFDAYVKNFAWTLAKDDAIRIQSSLRLTGAATLTTAAV